MTILEVFEIPKGMEFIVKERLFETGKSGTCGFQ